MTGLPTDIANQALDALGFDVVLGDIEDGSREAQIMLRSYQQCLRQLLRAAHWNFSRMERPMTLLADATGNTPNVGTLVPHPWWYEYEFPPDCMKARFVPHHRMGLASGIPAGNIVAPGANQPFLGGPSASPLRNLRNHPARFLVATDYNYAPPPGQITWEVQGVSPNGRTVILTNVQNAHLIYTALILYPSLWDANFRAAMVAYLASETALAIWSKKDRKFGLQIRGQQVAIAKEKIAAARVTDGNESFSSVTLPTDWMQFRRTGGGFGFGYGDYGGEPGVLGYGWDALSFGGDSTPY